MLMEGALKNNENRNSTNVSSIKLTILQNVFIVCHREDVSVLSKCLISEGFLVADCARSLPEQRANPVPPSIDVS